ncbi:transposase [Streptomyces sp. NPDC001307]|uniref:transposase n=1 Tax=Streptomyces sp. NPDC001307 TaxID=3364560 RepID=UPI0036A19DB8
MDDDLWVLIDPLLSPWSQKTPGPRPVDDRPCLQGILYGFGSGETSWRRLGRWHEAGVFDQLHRLLAELHAADELDWSRTCVDASHRATGPSPVDRGKTGSKRHMICDGRDPPFKVITTAADVNDVTQTLLWSSAWPSDGNDASTFTTPSSHHFSSDSVASLRVRAISSA